MKKTIYLICIFLLVSVSVVFGASCTSVPVEDCTVDGDLELDGGTYYLNDTNTNGAIIINADGVTLDCNGTTFIGNHTNNGVAIYVSFRDNIIVKVSILLLTELGTV